MLVHKNSSVLLIIDDSRGYHYSFRIVGFSSL